MGEEQAAKAAAKRMGGEEIFGARVLGSHTHTSADQVAKSQSVFGPSVVEGASADSVSVEELKKLLDTATGNPTLFDSLYEGELVRSGGPRKEALRVFKVTEIGIKGAGRQHILDEINSLLGENESLEKLAVSDIDARRKQAEQQADREEENADLKDAERLRSLRQREEDLKEIHKSSNAGTRSQIVSSESTDAQLRQIKGEDGKKPARKSTAKSARKSAKK